MEEKFLTEVRFFRREDMSLRNERVHPAFRPAIEWLDTYFKGEDPGPIPPVRLRGTPFRRMVWQLLQAIPYGHTVTYKEIAEKIIRKTGAERMSAQAVGNAVGHNPVSIFIPCHRVIGSNGNLTGYAGGLDKKVGLLKVEHIDVSHFYLPE